MNDLNEALSAIMEFKAALALQNKRMKATRDLDSTIAVVGLIADFVEQAADLGIPLAITAINNKGK